MLKIVTPLDLSVDLLELVSLKMIANIGQMKPSVPISQATLKILTNKKLVKNAAVQTTKVEASSMIVVFLRPRLSD